MMMETFPCTFKGEWEWEKEEEEELRAIDASDHYTPSITFLRIFTPLFGMNWDGLGMVWDGLGDGLLMKTSSVVEASDIN